MSDTIELRGPGGKRYLFRKIWWCDYEQRASQPPCPDPYCDHERCGWRLLEVTDE